MENGGRRRLALIALGLLVTAGLTLFAFGFDGDYAVELLRRHHLWLLGFVSAAPVVASVAFMVLYAAAVAISVPGVGLLTMIGGYLFGWIEGTVYVLVAATIGASAVFLMVRSAVGRGRRARTGSALQRFAEGFRRNALSYAFVLNLVPVFPYAMVIGIPAACGIGLRTFAAGVFFGIMPGTFLFARLGSALGDVLRQDLPLRLTSFLTPEIVLSLCGLAALALLPVVYRAYCALKSA